MVKRFAYDLIQLWKDNGWRDIVIGALWLGAIDYLFDWILIGVLGLCLKSKDVLHMALSIMLVLIILREILQMSFSPMKYFSLPENVILTLLICTGKCKSNSLKMYPSQKGGMSRSAHLLFDFR